MFDKPGAILVDWVYSLAFGMRVRPCTAKRKESDRLGDGQKGFSNWATLKSGTRNSFAAALFRQHFGAFFRRCQTQRVPCFTTLLTCFID